MQQHFFIFRERYHCFLEISSRYIHSLIKYVDIVNSELIESTLKQTIMCSCFKDFLLRINSQVSLIHGERALQLPVKYTGDFFFLHL
jgi:hypothetical protein